MTVTLTQRASTAITGDPSAQTLTSASFTPTANAKLYVFATAVNDSHSTSQVWSCSGGSLSWSQAALSSQVDYIADPLFGGRVALFEATVGASPSSMTVIIDAHSGAQVAYYSMVVFEATASGTLGLVQPIVVNAASKGGGDAETHTSASLASTTISGNRVVACFGVGTETFGVPSATPAGWSALTAQGQNYTQCAVFHRSDFAGTSVTCTDLGTVVALAGAVLFELVDTPPSLVVLAPIRSGMRQG